MSAEIGRIFNIQKFSIHDGPGIRTVVFLKGCPMGCAWCSNPNSRKLKPVMMRDATDANVFTADAKDYPLDEVVRICLQDLPFYQESGGGVTLSGGEALVQHRFSVALLRRLQELGLHTAIETTGYASSEIFKKALDVIDLLIIDVKHYDATQHKTWTTVSNKLPLENLATALARGQDTWVRIPVIPGVNNSLDDAAGFAKLLASMGVPRVQLLPFHQFGERKYELLGWDYRFSNVPGLPEEDLIEFRDAISAGGVTAYF